MTLHIQVATALLAISAAMTAVAQKPTVVQPFAGSEAVSSQYATDFDVLQYITSLEKEAIEISEIEGQLRAQLFRWPEDKNRIEVQRSFERALEEAGFDVLLSADMPGASGHPPEFLALRNVQEANRLGERGFGLAVQQVTVVPPKHYLAATRTQDGQSTVFTLTIGDRNIYLMEEATIAAMEEGTVEISAEALTAEIEEAGKAILYGVQFDTGSAAIRPSSAEALQTIAEVLNALEGTFYIVGHTDDVGAFEPNMRLSEERAAAVLAALVNDYRIDADRLRADGVGPLAPLASNETEAGRQVNRRVELVESLGNP
ncbi:MAG: OmpA family protein [Wenzhouxiangella sp.]|nr:OmpA family protein [Wenzhouxiangella sp.]